jgi:hypothetical protein
MNIILRTVIGYRKCIILGLKHTKHQKRTDYLEKSWCRYTKRPECYVIPSFPIFFNIGPYGSSPIFTPDIFTSKRRNKNSTCRLLCVLCCVWQTGYQSSESPLLFHRYVKQETLRTTASRHYPAIDSTCSPLTVNVTSHSALNKLYISQTSFRLSKYSWRETFPMWPVSKSLWRQLFYADWFLVLRRCK